jgi:hypothetical protein
VQGNDDTTLSLHVRPSMYRNQCGVVSDADAKSTVIHVYGWYIDDTVMDQQMSDACAVCGQAEQNMQINR